MVVHPSEQIAEFLVAETKALYGARYIGNRVMSLEAKPPKTPALHFLNTHTLRRVSLRVNRSLLAWDEGKYNLDFTTLVPTALEVLEMQCQGKRIVSLPKEKANNKTPYEFVIHDLEHADRFFFNAELHRSQVEFFRWIRVQIQRSLFKKHLENPIFQEKFNYLISDMNSHPAHMKQYLNHIVSECESSALTHYGH